ncbi:hypothetical protein F4802DRAFT_404980 [Xylaria palmicola]|nr:hypothetical protein F4802DRAFT_404980 [Xylaria palmicola]
MSPPPTQRQAIQADKTQAHQPANHGVPFKKMYNLREQVRQANGEVERARSNLSDAQKRVDCPQAQVERCLAVLRSKTAELESLEKKLAPMEVNFRKVNAKKARKQRIEQGENGENSAQQNPAVMTPMMTTPTVMTPMMNTATLEVVLPPEGCNLSTDECQFDHLMRLRRQYARPFELFCEEMDTISDTCLTAICLAMPNMPWSIVVSRLAFLFKSTLESPTSPPASSDIQYLSAGTTVGCEQHLRYIRLAEVMVIQDWRDFMRWSRHESYVFNLCGQRSCVKLKHMCLEPAGFRESREMCRAKLNTYHSNTYHHGQLTDEAIPLKPTTCSSMECWPACLPRHQTSNVLHAVAVEFAAFHHVSFGPVTSVMNKETYTPISERQLGRLIHDEDVGLTLPFKKSHGRILITMWKDDSLVQVDTLLPIPSTYPSGEVQHILQVLPTCADLSFNGIMSSLFWYARRRNIPYLPRETQQDSCWGTQFDHLSPRYECPFCYGFDNFDTVDCLVEGTAGFDDFIQALRHMLCAHPRVPIARKAKFLYEETLECPAICDAWKAALREEHAASMASLAKGQISQAIAELCGGLVLTEFLIKAIKKELAASKGDSHVAATGSAGDETEDTRSL